MLSILSTLVLLLIFCGILNARRPKVHIPIMTTAFLIDLGLVLYIELNREAVNQALSAQGLLLFHIIVSALVLLLYIILIVVGIKLVKKVPGQLLWHRRLAYVFIVGRLINYVTSFYIA
jgi:hypothetical protein